MMSLHVVVKNQCATRWNSVKIAMNVSMQLIRMRIKQQRRLQRQPRPQRQRLQQRLQLQVEFFLKGGPKF